MKTTAIEIIKNTIMEEASFLNEPFVDAIAEKIVTKLNFEGVTFVDINKCSPSKSMMQRSK